VRYLYPVVVSGTPSPSSNTCSVVGTFDLDVLIPRGLVVTLVVHDNVIFGDILENGADSNIEQLRYEIIINGVVDLGKDPLLETIPSTRHADASENAKNAEQQDKM
jgi:hypothetical protein